MGVDSNDHGAGHAQSTNGGARTIKEDATLVPVDLSDPKQSSIMISQRKICGWAADRIPTWHKHIQAGERAMFWIALPSTSPSALGLERSDASFDVEFARGGKSTRYLLVGHTALDRIDLPCGSHLLVDESLTAADGSVLTIASLFIMPTVKSSGLGSWSMRELERLAQEEPYGSTRCTAIHINSMAARHCKGGLPGPEGMDMLDEAGGPPERCLAPWYGSMGYVAYKEAPRYEVKPGVYAWAEFMRKELPPSK